MRPTMTINEILDRKREAGIHATYYTELRELTGGACPYGKAIPSPSGRNIVQVFRVDFEKWLASKCVPVEGGMMQS